MVALFGNRCSEKIGNNCLGYQVQNTGYNWYTHKMAFTLNTYLGQLFLMQDCGIDKSNPNLENLSCFSWSDRW